MGWRFWMDRAAVGLSVRAIGAGKKVFFAQFVKGQKYSEVKTITQFLPNITIAQYGLDCFIYQKPKQEDIDATRKGLQEVSKILSSNEYDLVVLDEANIALYYQLYSEEELLDILKKKQKISK